MSWSTSFLESVVRDALSTLTVILLDIGNPCRDKKFNSPTHENNAKINSTYDNSSKDIVTGVASVLAGAPNVRTQLKLSSV